MKTNEADTGMHILGITGGIGSGKSEVLHLLSDTPDSCIVEADRLAHQLMMPGRAAYHRIVECFGKEILAQDGTIDRSILGRIVMQSPENLEQLNRIVHPAVKKSIRGRIKRAEARGVRLFVIEAALLIQDGYRSICDELWYIFVEREIRIRRLLETRGGTRGKWDTFLANQPAERFFRENTDVTIENNGTKEELRLKINNELQRLFLK